MSESTQTPTLHLAHAAKPVTPRDRLIRLPEVERVTGFKKSTLYGWVKEGAFPRPIQIGRMSAWAESAVLQWVQDRIHQTAQVQQ